MESGINKIKEAAIHPPPKGRGILAETNMKTRYIVPTLAVTLMTGIAFAGDGSDEPGFVAPPHAKKLPSAPPRSVASAETYIAGGCCQPMARSEAKKPPTPPALVSKLTE